MGYRLHIFKSYILESSDINWCLKHRKISMEAVEKRQRVCSQMALVLLYIYTYECMLIFWTPEIHMQMHIEIMLQLSYRICFNLYLVQICCWDLCHNTYTHLFYSFFRSSSVSLSHSLCFKSLKHSHFAVCRLDNDKNRKKLYLFVERNKNQRNRYNAESAQNTNTNFVYLSE